MSENKKLTVLYVDEKEILLRASAITLENSGFEVIRCIGLDEAKKAFASRHIDVVLAEVNLDNGKHSPEADRFLLDCAAKGAGIVVLTGNILYAAPKEIRETTQVYRKPMPLIYVSRGIRCAYDIAQSRKEGVLDRKPAEKLELCLADLRKQDDKDLSQFMRQISPRNRERQGAVPSSGSEKSRIG